MTNRRETLPLTAEEEAELRERTTALTEGEGITPGPWHAVVGGDPQTYHWWLDNEAGDSSFPSPDDVALFVNLVPRLLATLDAAREQAATEARRELLAKVEAEQPCTCNPAYARTLGEDYAHALECVGKTSLRNGIRRLIEEAS